MEKNYKQFMSLEIDNKIAHLLFNRPPLNLFNLAVFAEFSEICDEIKDLVNRDEVRVVLLSSAIEKAFSAGDDVKGGPKTADEAVIQNDIARSVMKKMSELPVPLIGAINGYALGGGVVLALTCDYLIAADNTKLAFSEIDFGMFPNWGTTMVLGRKFSLSMVKKLLFTGERFTPDVAKELNMVQEIVPVEDLISTAMGLARTIAEKAPIGIRSLKSLLNSAAGGITDDGHYHLETIYTRLTFDSQDTAEGVLAFSEKRKPVFCNK